MQTDGHVPDYGEDGENTYILIKGMPYSAEGGKAYKGELNSDGKPVCASGGTGASDAGGWRTYADPSFSDGRPVDPKSNIVVGTSQGHTTRDFGEIEFEMNAGGTSGHHGSYGKNPPQRSSGYSEGSGEDGKDWPGRANTYPHSEGGAGYGGGGGAGGIAENSGVSYGSGAGGKGGDGTVLIRYYAYDEE